MIFDVSSLIQGKRKKLRLINEDTSLQEKSLALLSSATVNDLGDLLKIFCADFGIRLNIKEFEFGKWDEIALYEPNRINDCDFCVIWTGIRDNPVNIDRWQNAWNNITIPIIQTNFELPPYRPLGNFEGINGNVRAIRALNEEFANAKKSGLYICDQEYISSYVGLDRWFEPKLWHAYKIATSALGCAALAFNISKMIGALLGKSKKALALDLDNTLWGGVAGDDGAQNLQIGETGSEGEAFREFQNYLKSLQNKGVILTLNSKNEQSTINEIFETLTMPLKLSDFSAQKINWEQKDANIKALANELNIGEDTFVFIDDNPAERALVAQNLPHVCTPNLNDDSSSFAKIIDLQNYFESVTLSTEDINRAQSYAQNALRQEHSAQFENYGEYLKSLEMKADFSAAKPHEIARISQLINKTNQFNLTTKRSDEGYVAKILQDANYIYVVGRLSDKFGDYGLTAFIGGVLEGANVDIEFWLMSCRVFKREFEFAIFNEFVQKAANLGAKTITGRYIPTAKNGIVANLYNELGFAAQKDAFVLDVSSLQKINGKFHTNIRT